MASLFVRVKIINLHHGKQKGIFEELKTIAVAHQGREHPQQLHLRQTLEFMDHSTIWYCY